MQTITHHYQFSCPRTPSDIFDVFLLQHVYQVSSTKTHTLLEGSYTIYAWYTYRKAFFTLSDTQAFPISYFLPLSSHRMGDESRTTCFSFSSFTKWDTRCRNFLISSMILSFFCDKKITEKISFLWYNRGIESERER